MSAEVLNPWVSCAPSEPGHYELLLDTGLLFVIELHRDRFGGLTIWGGPYDGKALDDWGVPGLTGGHWRRTDVRSSWSQP